MKKAITRRRLMELTAAFAASSVVAHNVQAQAYPNRIMRQVRKLGRLMKVKVTVPMSRATFTSALQASCIAGFSRSLARLRSAADCFGLRVVEIGYVRRCEFSPQVAQFGYAGFGKFGLISKCQSRAA
jgi:hypothetical protein